MLIWPKYLPLLAQNIDANAQALDGTTALMIAAEKGYSQIAFALLDKGADVNYIRKKFGATALMLAAAHGRTEIVELLLSRGADVNAKNDDGSSPLMVASMNGYIAVAKQLIAAGADVNVVDKDHDTALGLATSQGYRDVVKVLLDAGARVDESTLSIVADSNYAEIREILINHGVNVNTRNLQGKTWLIQAAETGDLPAVKTLLKAGADLNLKTKMERVH